MMEILSAGDCNQSTERESRKRRRERKNEEKERKIGKKAIQQVCNSFFLRSNQSESDSHLLIQGMGVTGKF